MKLSFTKTRHIIEILFAFVCGFFFADWFQQEYTAGIDDRQYLPEELKHKKRMQFRNDNFRPLRQHVEELLSRKSLVLANWDYYESTRPLEITSIELIGFESYSPKGNEEIHLTITDDKYLRMFNAGLKPEQMRREGRSDLSMIDISFGCGYGPDGVILLHTPQKKILIGVTCIGFQLDSVETYQRTKFESWIMAKALDDIFTEYLGKPLNKLTFDILSGDLIRDSQTKYYEELNENNN